jgi:pyruvate dehydrogenase E2 component (dihydrolipoamide acetyltransferase)
MAVPSIKDVPMPHLSDTMEDGTVIKWLREPGNQVILGEPLVEIETDNASMVYESDAAETLLEVVPPEGATVAVGEVIARIGPPAELTNAGAS